MGANPMGVLWTAVRSGTSQLVIGLLSGMGLAYVVVPLLGDALGEARPAEPAAVPTRMTQFPRIYGSSNMWRCGPNVPVRR